MLCRYAARAHYIHIENNRLQPQDNAHGESRAEDRVCTANLIRFGVHPINDEPGMLLASDSLLSDKPLESKEGESALPTKTYRPRT